MLLGRQCSSQGLVPRLQGDLLLLLFWSRRTWFSVPTMTSQGQFDALGGIHVARGGYLRLDGAAINNAIIVSSFYGGISA